MTTTSSRHAFPGAVALSVIACSLLLAGCDLFKADDDSGSAAPALTPGIYTFADSVTLTEEEDEVDGFVITRSMMELRADGSYFLQGYATSEELVLENSLLFEEKGFFLLKDTLLIRSGRSERYLSFDERVIDAWAVPEDGAVDTHTIRKIMPDSFEVYGKENSEWRDWRRLSPAETPRTSFRGEYRDHTAGYSLHFPENWAAGLDQMLGSALYRLRAQRTSSQGVSSIFIILQSPRVVGQSLQARMNAEAANLEASSITVNSQEMQTRGGVPVGKVVFTLSVSGTTLKYGWLMFERGDSVTIIQSTDLASRFDGDAEIRHIDSSLTFFTDINAKAAPLAKASVPAADAVAHAKGPARLFTQENTAGSRPAALQDLRRVARRAF